MNELQSEYGSSQPIRFGNATMYNSDSEPTLCKCGNAASGGAIGQYSYTVWCADCDPNKDAYVAKFVYQPSSECKIDIPDHLTSFWES